MEHSTYTDHQSSQNYASKGTENTTQMMVEQCGWDRNAGNSSCAIKCTARAGRAFPVREVDETPIRNFQTVEIQ